MKLLNKEITRRLIENFESKTADHRPVVRLFCGAACTWLLSELNKDTNIAFGLCDFGHGQVELGYVSIDELQELRFPKLKGMFADGIVRQDVFFVADKTLVEYAKDAADSEMMG